MWLDSMEGLEVCCYLLRFEEAASEKRNREEEATGEKNREEEAKIIVSNNK